MPYIGKYRTKSGKFTFRWSFESQSDDKIRIYILDAPGYGSRRSDGHSTHRYRQDDGKCYICYEPMPTKLQHAIAIAKAWAERTEAYILHSQEF